MEVIFEFAFLLHLQNMKQQTPKTKTPISRPYMWFLKIKRQRQRVTKSGYSKHLELFGTRPQKINVLGHLLQKTTIQNL